MRRLYYAGGEVLLADATCKAILRYARALAENQQFDVVSVPVVGVGGEHGSAHLLLGPTSELFSTPVVEGGEDLDDLELVRNLEQRTQGIHPLRPEWSDEMSDIPDYR
jgi:uncharacterized protein related to proFAR isomerase